MASKGRQWKNMENEHEFDIQIKVKSLVERLYPLTFTNQIICGICLEYQDKK